MTVRIVCPAALSGDPAVLATSERICCTTSGTVFDTEDIEQGIRGVDFIYTDTWVRIGEPVARWWDRVTILASYRVDQDLLARTGNPDAKYLHNLPAIHNAQTTIGLQIYEETGLDAAEETDEVFKSKASIVFDQTENRMHAIKAVMVASLGTRHDETKTDDSTRVVALPGPCVQALRRHRAQQAAERSAVGD
jgi:ornithine carbamoyltransferase